GAEAVYARLTEDQRAIARDVLRQMTAVDRDGRLVCRPVSRSGRDGRADAVLGALAQGRLVACRGVRGDQGFVPTEPAQCWATTRRRWRTTRCCKPGRDCAAGWRRIS